jgi:hypothetical protein
VSRCAAHTFPNTHPRLQTQRDIVASVVSQSLLSTWHAFTPLLPSVQVLGFPGVQIGSHVNTWNLDHPELEPFFKVRTDTHLMHLCLSVWMSELWTALVQAASELNACIFVHPWDMAKDERLKPYWMPWLVGLSAVTVPVF